MAERHQFPVWRIRSLDGPHKDWSDWRVGDSPVTDSPQSFVSVPLGSRYKPEWHRLEIQGGVATVEIDAVPAPASPGQGEGERNG